MAADLALTYDTAARRADLAFGNRGLLLDATPCSQAIASLLSDRRARPDEGLPSQPAPLLQPDQINPRRGWCGDALDQQGGRAGSRLWLLIRAKETPETRRRAERYAGEALAWASPLGLTVAAEWVRRGVLRLTCRFGRDELVIDQPVT